MFQIFSKANPLETAEKASTKIVVNALIPFLIPLGILTETTCSGKPFNTMVINPLSGIPII